MRKLFACAAALAVLCAFMGCCKGIKDKVTKETKTLETTPGGGAVAGAIEGHYAAAGTNPDGSSYKCEVEIKKNGQAYPVAWYFDGKLAYEGTGILKGNTFVVGFINPQGYGVVAYDIKADGSLDGTWTGKGATKAGNEKLTKK